MLDRSGYAPIEFRRPRRLRDFHDMNDFQLESAMRHYGFEDQMWWDNPAYGPLQGHGAGRHWCEGEDLRAARYRFSDGERLRIICGILQWVGAYRVEEWLRRHEGFRVMGRRRGYEVRETRARRGYLH